MNYCKKCKREVMVLIQGETRVCLICKAPVGEHPGRRKAHAVHLPLGAYIEKVRGHLKSYKRVSHLTY